MQNENKIMEKNVCDVYRTEVSIVDNKQVAQFVRANYMQCK